MEVHEIIKKPLVQKNDRLCTMKCNIVLYLVLYIELNAVDAAVEFLAGPQGLCM